MLSSYICYNKLRYIDSLNTCIIVTNIILINKLLHGNIDFVKVCSILRDKFSKRFQIQSFEMLLLREIHRSLFLYPK